MKICGIICEYNPFHNGHQYQIELAKRKTGADAVVCLMSGNFVQRGEAAILEKHVRAKHAILGGADAVLELPVRFATSNAELFAKGAIKLLSSIPDLQYLSFGVESATEESLIQAATLLNNEPKEISKKIQEGLSHGLSLAKARAEAWSKILPEPLLTSPNNVLAIEYTRAILSCDANIAISPVQRVGEGYLSAEINSPFPSATAIRATLANGVAAQGVPSFVQRELLPPKTDVLGAIERYAILFKDKRDVAKTPDCTEGLENALLKAAKNGENDPVESLTSTRYTASRIRRILLQNALNVTSEDIRQALSSQLYLKLLAARKDREDVLSALSKSDFPLLVRPFDKEKLSTEAKRCLESDEFAENVYAAITGEPPRKPEFI